MEKKTKAIPIKGVLSRVIPGKQLGKNGWSIGLILKGSDVIHNITAFDQTVEKAKEKAEAIMGNSTPGYTYSLIQEQVVSGDRTFINVVKLEEDKNAAFQMPDGSKPPGFKRGDEVKKPPDKKKRMPWIDDETAKIIESRLEKMFNWCLKKVRKDFPDATPDQVSSMVNTLFIEYKSHAREEARRR